MSLSFTSIPFHAGLYFSFTLHHRFTRRHLLPLISTSYFNTVTFYFDLYHFEHAEAVVLALATRRLFML